MSRVWKSRKMVVAVVAVTLVVGVASLAGAWRKGSGLPRQYENLLSQGDQLWSEYKMADRAYFDHGRTDLRSHAMQLAGIQDRLAGVHTQWMQTDAPSGLEALDLKVGLALELQMAAVGAELVGLLDDDQSYLDLSAELDGEYETVVNDL